MTLAAAEGYSWQSRYALRGSKPLDPMPSRPSSETSDCGITRSLRKPMERSMVKVTASRETIAIGNHPDAATDEQRKDVDRFDLSLISCGEGGLRFAGIIGERFAIVIHGDGAFVERLLAGARRIGGGVRFGNLPASNRAGMEFQTSITAISGSANRDLSETRGNLTTAKLHAHVLKYGIGNSG